MSKNTPNKTQATEASVEEFINSISLEERRNDARAVCQLMQDITGHEPKMWGPSIIGFGTYHYKYASGREGDMGVLSFSPRKENLTTYLVDGVSRYEDLLAQLGPHTLGKGCLYIKRLDQVDLEILKQILENSYQYVLNHQVDRGRVE